MTPDTGLNLGLNPENNVLPGSAEKLNSFTTNFTNLTQVFEPTENTNDPVEINEKGAELTPLQPACQPLTVATNPMSESNEIGFSNNHSLPSNNFPNNGYDRAGSSLLKIQEQNFSGVGLPSMTPIHNNKHDFQNAPVHRQIEITSNHHLIHDRMNIDVETGLTEPIMNQPRLSIPGSTANNRLTVHQQYQNDLNVNQERTFNHKTNFSNQNFNQNQLQNVDEGSEHDEQDQSTDYKSDLPSNVDTPVKMNANMQNIQNNQNIDVVEFSNAENAMTRSNQELISSQMQNFEVEGMGPMCGHGFQNHPPGANQELVHGIIQSQIQGQIGGQIGDQIHQNVQNTLENQENQANRQIHETPEHQSLQFQQAQLHLQSNQYQQQQLQNRQIQQRLQMNQEVNHQIQENCPPVHNLPQWQQQQQQQQVHHIPAGNNLATLQSPGFQHFIYSNQPLIPNHHNSMNFDFFTQHETLNVPPRPARSAFEIFIATCRESYQQQGNCGGGQNGGTEADIKELTAKAENHWTNDIDSNSKQRYVRMAQEEENRYGVERAEYLQKHSMQLRQGNHRECETEDGGEREREPKIDFNRNLLSPDENNNCLKQQFEKKIENLENKPDLKKTENDRKNDVENEDDDIMEVKNLKHNILQQNHYRTHQNDQSQSLPQNHHQQMNQPLNHPQFQQNQGFIRQIQLPEANQIFIQQQQQQHASANKNQHQIVMLQSPIPVDASNQILNTNMMNRRIMQSSCQNSAFTVPKTGPPNIDMSLFQTQMNGHIQKIPNEGSQFHAQQVHQAQMHQAQVQQVQNLQRVQFQNLVSNHGNGPNMQTSPQELQRFMHLQQLQNQEARVQAQNRENAPQGIKIRGEYKHTTTQPNTARPTQKRRKKDPNEPKKPPTAFFLFMKSNRESIRNDNPEAKVTDIAKIAGEIWRNMDRDQRGEYTIWHDKLKSLYDNQISCFKKKVKYEGEDYDDILPSKFRKSRIMGQAVGRKRGGEKVDEDVIVIGEKERKVENKQIQKGSASIHRNIENGNTENSGNVNVRRMIVGTNDSTNNESMNVENSNENARTGFDCVNLLVSDTDKWNKKIENQMATNDISASNDDVQSKQLSQTLQQQESTSSLVTKSDK